MIVILFSFRFRFDFENEMSLEKAREFRYLSWQRNDE
jgi:hypothetical protein